MIDLAYELFQLVFLCFFNTRDALISCTQSVSFFKVRITLDSGFGYPSQDMSCVWQVSLVLITCGVKGVHPVSEVLITVVV